MSLVLNFAGTVEAVANNNEGFINKCGLYPVTIKFISFSQTSTGSWKFDLNIEHKGASQVIWGSVFRDKDGEPVSIGARQMEALGTMIGLEPNSSLTTTTRTFNIGKDNKPTSFLIAEEFCDLEVQLRLQLEYSEYNGIRENLVIRNIFRAEDGASAEEIRAGVPTEELGKQLRLEMENHNNGPIYRDGLTPEQVEEWIKGGRNKGTTPAPTSASTKKKTSMFG